MTPFCAGPTGRRGELRIAKQTAPPPGSSVVLWPLPPDWPVGLSFSQQPQFPV